MSKPSAGLSIADLRALYQAVILDHNRNPRNRRRAEGETARARGFNALCGDDVSVSLALDAEGCVADIGFEGKACAICTASASCLTEVAKGLDVAALTALAARFEGAIRGASGWEALAANELLQAFAPVSGFPSRIKCAILPWRALTEALSGSEQTVTTEGL